MSADPIVDCAVYVDGRRDPHSYTYAQALAHVRDTGKGFVWLGVHSPDDKQMTEIAKRHDVTRAAVSKRCVELTQALNLKPSRAMRSRTDGSPRTRPIARARSAPSPGRMTPGRPSRASPRRSNGCSRLLEWTMRWVRSCPICFNGRISVI